MVAELKVKVTPVFDKLYRTVQGLTGLSTIVEVGGAGSSKSHSIAQLLIQLLTEHTGLRIGVGRKTFPSHRTSGMALIIGLLKEYGIYSEREHNKTENSYEHNGNYMLFFSLGEGESGREKIKSANFNIIWDEEATEFELADYRQQMLRLRHPAPVGMHNFMILSHNPIDEMHWIKTELIDKDKSVIVHHSTYKDNAFCPKDYAKLLEDLQNQDPNYYRIYVLGEWGRLENVIYSNWQIAELPDKSKWSAWCYGQDYGFTNPAALLKVVISQGKLYWDECLYQSGLTNADIIERMTHEDKADVYADSAEPDRIEEIHRAGWNIYPANKDVKMGIDVCKRQTIYITPRSVNTIKEVKGYARKKDKNGVVLEEPIKFNDHAVDAGRYGTLGITERFGFATSASGNKPRSKHSFRL